MLGKATLARKRMELLHDMMEGRHCGQLKQACSSVVTIGQAMRGAE